MTDFVECDVEGCEERSRYLLTCGDRCPEHAREEQPDTVEYINWAMEGAAE